MVRTGKRVRIRSLYARLLGLSVALVVIPGVVFALVAFSNTRRSLESAVGIQLAQAAEEGADRLGAVLEQVAGEATSWGRQDVMRELLIGDVDKRVSRFLDSASHSRDTYSDIVCADPSGRVVAASAGGRLGEGVAGWASFEAARSGKRSIHGPRPARLSTGLVLEVATPIFNPDPPKQPIGVLILLLDWAHAETVLARVRDKFARLDKQVGVFIVGRNGRVVGRGSSSDAVERRFVWRLPSGFKYGRWVPDGANESFLVGTAPAVGIDLGWSVVAVERLDAALAPVAAMRRRWAAILAGVLFLGLTAAAVLAARMVRPLRELRDAAGDLAANPSQRLAAVPVRSDDEIGQLAEAFNAMAADLQQAQSQLLSAAKFAFAGELAAGVAHEVRTPLSVMRSSAQMLLNAPPAQPGDNSELVQMLVDEVDRVERVVSGLLELARPQPRHIEPTDIPAVLARAIDFIEVQASRQDVTIERDFADAMPLARCDREQTYQVALNLIVNALQALGSGGRVVVRASPDDAHNVRFEVRDDGPGIPPELRERIFRPFVTGREGGTGLGLALVKRMVEEHGGSIEIETEDGRGTTVRVRLPRAEGA